PGVGPAGLSGVPPVAHPTRRRRCATCSRPFWFFSGRDSALTARRHPFIIPALRSDEIDLTPFLRGVEHDAYDDRRDPRRGPWPAHDRRPRAGPGGGRRALCQAAAAA